MSKRNELDELKKFPIPYKVSQETERGGGAVESPGEPKSPSR